MKVKFFAYYRDIFRCREKNIEDCDTVQSLVDELCRIYGKPAGNIFYIGDEFSPEVIIMVNGRHINHLQGLDTMVGPEDTVSFFPVVAGG